MNILIKPFKSIAVFCLLFSVSVAGFAAIDAYEFTDPDRQARYRVLVDELRCPQCLNTNLSGSDSMIAKDLRREIYRSIEAGQTDDEIRQFMYERYGDFILYRPRVNKSTFVLWFGPLILLVLGLGILHRFVFRKRGSTSVDLSEDEQTRLKNILESKDKK